MIAKVQECKVRGLTWLPHGQQFNGWVPKGHYSYAGECTVNYSSLGQTMTATAWKLVSSKEGTWYVSPRSVVLHKTKEG